MSKYNRKRRSDAAARGWATRRQNEKHLAQPEYLKTSLPTLPPSDTIEIAAELPITYNSLAGGIPKWEDPVLELDPLAYVKMRRCLAVKKALRKLAIRSAKLNWTIVGATKKPKPAPEMPQLPVLPAPKAIPFPTKANAEPELDDAEPMEDEADKPQTRADAVKEIFAQIRGWTDFVEHLTGSLVEGTRFYQIKTAEAREGSEQPWSVPDFFMGARHRYNAGGDIEWDGADRLVQTIQRSGVISRQTAQLPIEQFVIHRPGGGSNPEGDLDTGVAIFNGVVVPWTRGITSGDLWVRLFAVPAILLGAKIDKARPDRIAEMLENRARALNNAVSESPGTTTALSNQDTVNLLNADPAGITGIVAWQQYLEGLADDTLTLAALTSSAGVSQANRTGDTSEQKDNEDEAAFYNAVQIAETFNRHVKPWIDKRNELPELQEGEGDWYLWPSDPNEGDEQDIEVEDEAAALKADDQPEAVKEAAMFAAMQGRAYQARKDAAQVALAAFQPLPPVH